MAETSLLAVGAMFAAVALAGAAARALGQSVIPFYIVAGGWSARTSPATSGCPRSPTASSSPSSRNWGSSPCSSSSGWSSASTGCWRAATAC